MRGLAEVLTSRILKGRERIASLHATSAKMAQLGIGLDQQLQRLPQQEDRLCRLLRDASRGIWAWSMHGVVSNNRLMAAFVIRSC